MGKRNWKSDLEALAAIGSGALLDPIAGLAGIGGVVLPGRPGQGARAVEAVRGLGYEPRNPATLEAIGNLIKTPLEYYTRGMDYVGNKTAEATGSPLLGSIAGHSPELIGTVLGLKGLRAPRARAGAVIDDTVDQSRRQFLKRAGLTAAAAPVLGPSLVKGLLDGGAAVETAAKAVGSAAPSITAAVPDLVVSPNAYRIASYLKAFPEIGEDDLIKAMHGDPEEFEAFWDNLDLDHLDKSDGELGFRLKDELQNTFGHLHGPDDFYQALDLLEAYKDPTKTFMVDVPDEFSSEYLFRGTAGAPGHIPHEVREILDDIGADTRGRYEEWGELFDPASSRMGVKTDDEMRDLLKMMNSHTDQLPNMSSSELFDYVKANHKDIHPYVLKHHLEDLDMDPGEILRLDHNVDYNDGVGRFLDQYETWDEFNNPGKYE